VITHTLEISKSFHRVRIKIPFCDFTHLGYNALTITKTMMPTGMKYE